MRRRPRPDPVSPRALARLRAARGGWVPEPPAPVAPRWAGPEPVLPPAAAPGPPAPDQGRHRRVTPRPGWVRVPASFVGATWQPHRAAVAGMVLVAVLVASVLGLRVAWAQSATGGDVVAPGGGSRAGPVGVSAGAAPVGVPAGAEPMAAGPSAAGSAPGSTTPTPSAGAVGTLVVHVVGRVARPGVRRLPVGARVADAVDASGGATRDADLGAVNLARLLVDGEQVRVPAPGEVVGPPAPGGPTGGVGGSSGGTPGGGAGGLVPLNTADVAALDTLPGIGPVLAQRILDWRQEHGRFTSVDELGEVSGIGEKLLAQLRPLVAV